MPGRRRLIVSIHDLTPSLLPECRWLLEACTEIGARPVVLKVIPDQGGSDDIRLHSEFISLMHRERESGSEIVQHGYTHQAAGSIRGRGTTALRARLFAASIAEFATLEAEQMQEHLVAGRRILQAAGLDPQGFCAPGWLAAPELPRVLKNCGYRYLVTMATLRDVQAGTKIFTPWSGYMGSDAMQERLVGFGGRCCRLIARDNSPLKVFLHPQGAMHSAHCAASLKLLKNLVRNHTVVTYADLLH